MSGLLPKEGRWIARPKKPRWKPTFLKGLGFSLLLQVGQKIYRFSRSPWIDGALIAGVLFLVGIAIREIVSRRRTAADKAMIEEAFGDQFSVEVTLTVGDAPLGYDRGILWFSEGLMGFSGSAFSFVLAASDFTRQQEAVQMVGHASKVPEHAFVLRDSPEPAYLLIVPLSGHEKAYYERLDQFVEANENPQHERFWPPFERYVEERPMEAALER